MPRANRYILPVQLNMVRCGFVKHPREWAWSGYHELMGSRRRNRLLDDNKLRFLLRGPERAILRSQLQYALESEIVEDRLRRQEKWTQSLAVDRRGFVEQAQWKMRNRQNTAVAEEGGNWVLREDKSLF